LQVAVEAEEVEVVVVGAVVVEEVELAVVVLEVVVEVVGVVPNSSKKLLLPYLAPG
jgi:hypothetical protein